mmetsp:Transcript_21315/g.63877  ORF Transcript_21315/g.63877 Transcript_21315/m.63877 type:complete len:331 (+) Transcript_21315:534-1526(+)
MACAATSSHFSGDSLSMWRILALRSPLSSIASTSRWNWPTFSMHSSSGGSCRSKPSSLHDVGMSYSLSTVALPMCTSLVTPSVTEGMSLLMACFTRFVATTNDSDTACVTCGSGCPAVSTAHSIRRNVGALPASSASLLVVSSSSDRFSRPPSAGKKHRNTASSPPSRFNSALVWWPMMHASSIDCVGRLPSGTTSLYFSPLSTHSSSCMPGGGPSVTVLPSWSTSLTCRLAPHFALRWSSIKYLVLSWRLHSRDGLNWHRWHAESPHPDAWQSWSMTSRNSRLRCASSSFCWMYANVSSNSARSDCGGRLAATGRVTRASAKAWTLLSA